MLTNLQAREVLFIDEVHRMSPAIEEILYPAMEDYELDIMIGQGPGARSVKVPVQPFTLIGATTRTGLLTSPLRARFGIVHRLDFYTEHDIDEIVRRSARILGVADRCRRGDGDRAALARHAARRQPAAAARPRLRAGARRRPRSPRDVAQRALQLLEVDEHGFDEIDRRLLRTIIDKFGGGPVGVASLAAAMSEERDAIEDIYEPFLIQIGFLDRTPRGRVATARAYEYFGLAAPGRIVCGRLQVGFPPRPLRPVKIAGLSTYVPPRLLTNADLEKLVETTDEWILQRTGIRERHIVDPGVGDVGPGEGGRRSARCGRPASRPTDIGFIVVGTTTPDTIFPSTACMLQHKIGAHSAWGFDLGAACSGLHLRADDRDADGRDRRARPRAGRRRRRDVEHHRLHAIARPACCSATAPARSCCRRPSDGEPAIIDFAHEIDGSGGPALCMPAGGSRMPASHETVDQRLHYVKQDGQAVFKFAVRKTRGDLPARCSIGTASTRPSSICSSRTRPTAASSQAAAERLGLPESTRSSSTSRCTATRPRRRFRWRWPTPCATAAEAGRPGAAGVGRRRVHRRRGAAALEPVAGC